MELKTKEHEASSFGNNTNYQERHEETPSGIEPVLLHASKRLSIIQSTLTRYTRHIKYEYRVPHQLGRDGKGVKIANRLQRQKLSGGSRFQMRSRICHEVVPRS